MNRYNAIVVATMVGTLSVLTCMYAYYGTCSVGRPVLMHTMITKARNTVAQEDCKPTALEKKLVLMIKEHELLRATNIALVNAFKLEHKNIAREKSYFASTLNETPFESRRQKITAIKKEICALKQTNKKINKEIKKMSKKKVE